MRERERERWVRNEQESTVVHEQGTHGLGGQEVVRGANFEIDGSGVSAPSLETKAEFGVQVDTPFLSGD